MICFGRFMAIGSGIQVILNLLPQQFERLPSWYYRWKGFMKYAVEVTAGGTIHMATFKLDILFAGKMRNCVLLSDNNKCPVSLTGLNLVLQDSKYVPLRCSLIH
jgi:hypothetical protein